MKLIKTYENCFTLIRDLFNSGQMISMVNSRCWVTCNEDKDDSKFTITLPNLRKNDGVYIDGNKPEYNKHSDLDVLCEFLEEVLKEISIFYGEHSDIPEEERFDFGKYLG